MLAIIVFHFAQAEGPDTPKPQEAIDAQQFTPKQWYWFHTICGSSIIAGVIIFWINRWLGGPDRYALFILELVATAAFSASWFAKGWEWDILRMANPDR